MQEDRQTKGKHKRLVVRLHTARGAVLADSVMLLRLLTA